MRHFSTIRRISALVLVLSTSLISARVSSAKDKRTVAELHRVMAIQARNQAAILKLPGVEGIGISADTHGFQILIAVNEAKGHPQLPCSIEGIRVKILRMTGAVALGRTVGAGNLQGTSHTSRAEDHKFYSPLDPYGHPRTY